MLNVSYQHTVPEPVVHTTWLTCTSVKALSQVLEQHVLPSGEDLVYFSNTLLNHSLHVLQQPASVIVHVSSFSF